MNAIKTAGHTAWFVIKTVQVGASALALAAEIALVAIVATQFI